MPSLCNITLRDNLLYGEGTGLPISWLLNTKQLCNSTIVDITNNDFFFYPKMTKVENKTDATVGKGSLIYSLFPLTLPDGLFWRNSNGWVYGAPLSNGIAGSTPYTIRLVNGSYSSTYKFDVTIASCLSPANGYNYTVKPCSPKRKLQTNINSCSTPLVDQYTIAACMPGSASVVGGQTVINDCTTGIADGFYSSSACAAGNSSIAGTDTVIKRCTPYSPPKIGQFISSVCTRGSSTRRGTDFELINCTAPAIGQYVNSPCSPGVGFIGGNNEYEIVTGYDTDLKNCSLPVPGYSYTLNACSPGTKNKINLNTYFNQHFIYFML